MPYPRTATKCLLPRASAAVGMYEKVTRRSTSQAAIGTAASPPSTPTFIKKTSPILPSVTSPPSIEPRYTRSSPRGTSTVHGNYTTVLGRRYASATRLVPACHLTSAASSSS
ncbi:hypothetical protein NGA_0483200, partial [Nannochloropsis gaditana CCMP526]|uniref:uncharacterized protein n=1 Tax=Nannochloropsis gaditana (strain CCMP526) TaxID=1093141 RepID=UPI00029F7B01